MSNRPSRRRFTPVQWIITILIVLLALFVFTRITPQSAAPGSEPNAEAPTVQPTPVVDAPADEPAGEAVDEAVDEAAQPTAAAAEAEPAGAAAIATPQEAAGQPSDPAPTVMPSEEALCNSEQVSDLPAIAYDELPPEAHETIALVQSGGPFPYDQDGNPFQNREGILPAEARGYYREYTVVTPGESDRGARRIVGGEVDELYYTDDHYASFSEVLCP